MSPACRIAAALLLASGSLFSGQTEGFSQEVGVSENRILFGQSAAFTGPARELGRNMRLGIEAAFHEVNARGGVHERQLELESLDDAYEPEAAIANTHRLIDERKVFALIGAVGTPTSRASTPVAASSGVPYIAPFTGAAFLRDEEWDNVINLRASYSQEIDTMISHLTDRLGIDRIGVMYQDDSFGRDTFRSLRRSLGRRQLKPVSVGVYQRNTTAVKTPLLDLLDKNPGAVILIGAYKPVASLIAWARHTGMKAKFMALSFVGSNALSEELGPAGVGVFVTQVVPPPTDTTHPITANYNRALRAFDPDATPGFVSFEGYLAGRLAIAALERCGREVDRAGFLDSLRLSDPIDLDGFELRFSDTDNQGSDSVFLTEIGSDGYYHPVETRRNGVEP